MQYTKLDFSKNFLLRGVPIAIGTNSHTHTGASPSSWCVYHSDNYRSRHLGIGVQIYQFEYIILQVYSLQLTLISFRDISLGF